MSVYNLITHNLLYRLICNFSQSWLIYLGVTCSNCKFDFFLRSKMASVCMTSSPRSLRTCIQTLSELLGEPPCTLRMSTPPPLDLRPRPAPPLAPPSPWVHLQHYIEKFTLVVWKRLLGSKSPKELALHSLLPTGYHVFSFQFKKGMYSILTCFKMF